MSLISIEFVVFFLCCFILYYALPKYQKAILLLGSCVFIGYYHIAFLVIAVAIAMLTYLFGRLIADSDSDRKAGWLYFSSIILLAFVWLALRYPWIIPKDKFLFPLGISFYTFQALAYLTEVYWGSQEKEKNVVDFLIYMLFFMKFLSGPIERPGTFLPQIKTEKRFDYDCVTFGMKLLFLGMIKKLLIADNMGSYIDGMYTNLHSDSGIQLVLTCLLYPIQLYTDFSGYTDMAIGGAAMFGIKLSPNFDRPFISKSTSELWRRWHMSLSFWVRDYVYVPLTTVTRRWKRFGVSVSLLVTFTVLGLWHGAGMNFVVYGMIQGIIIIYEMETTSFHAKLLDLLGHKIYNVVFIIRTYILYALSLVFFRAESLNDATYFISHLSLSLKAGWRDFKIMPDHNYIICGISFLLLMFYEHFNDKQDLIKSMNKLPAAPRWIIYYALLLLLFIFGAFNSDTFVYLQF